MTTLSGRDEPRPWRGRFLLYGVGAAAILWGLRGIVVDAAVTQPVNWAVFFVLGVLGHDVLLAPIVFVVALVGVRRLPARYRSLVQAGVVVSGLVTLVALPVVLGFGRRPDVPSQLPLPYLRNLLLILALVWAAVAVLVVRRRIQRSRAVME